MRSKALLYKTVAELHQFRIVDRTIARLTGVSPVHVRRILNHYGLTRRWCQLDDVRASLPDELREACTNLGAARRG